MVNQIGILIMIGMGFFWGVTLIRKKKYKYGVSIMVASLAAIGGYSFLNDLRLEINNTKQQIGELKIVSNQTIELQQKINNTVNVVTKVEKEVANIKEVIGDIYRHGKIERFTKKDIGKRVKIFTRIGRSGNDSIVYFQLNFIPIENSITLSDDVGVCPQLTYSIMRNIVIFRTNTKPEIILADDEAFYCISYFQDYSVDEPLYTVVDMEYKGTHEDINKAVFKPLINE